MKKKAILTICVVICCMLFGCGTVESNTPNSVTDPPADNIVENNEGDHDTQSEAPEEPEDFENSGDNNIDSEDDSHINDNSPLVDNTDNNSIPESGSTDEFPVYDLRNAEIDYGNSELFTREEIDNAITEIGAELESWGNNSIKLLSITYCSDEKSLAYRDELIALGHPEVANEYKDFILFDVNRVALEDLVTGQSAGTEILWRWYIGRSDGGDWVILDHGPDFID